MQAEQSNTSVMFGDRLLLKLIRRAEEGISPDLEMARFLSDRTNFDPVAPVAGGLEYRVEQEQPMTIAVLHGYVRNEGDAWHYTLANLDRYFERVLTSGNQLPERAATTLSLIELAGQPVPEDVESLLGEYLPAARLLGQRTAQLHAVLASGTTDADFAPERFTIHYQRALYQSLRAANRQSFDLLRQFRPQLGGSDAELADQVLAIEGAINMKLQRALQRLVDATRIRIHGDYHLGQALHTGRDFVIIDFEGEPNRPLTQRRMKRCPLVDVAGMIRSFSYAATWGLRMSALRREDVPQLEPWADFWYRWAAATYLGAYLETAEGATWLPDDRSEIRRLLDVFLLEKAAYELGYELSHRPDWVSIPLRGMLDLVRGADSEPADAPVAMDPKET